MEISLSPSTTEDPSGSGQAMETQPSSPLPPHRSLTVTSEAVLHEVEVRGVNSDPGEGNHSSEEELEEINELGKKQYVERAGEREREGKRKWTDLSQSESSATESDTEFEEPELRLELSAGGGEERSTSTSAGSYSCDTPVSGDEADTGRPVQFSTSPPVDVHKPRRSLSPPGPGVFGFPHSNGQHGPLSPAPSPAPLRSNNPSQSSSLGDLSRLETGETEAGARSERRGSCKKTISPRKKSRTSRVHHIQRPCLDFEKMQQLRTRAVNWRHGGELSLFCW